MNDEYYDMAEYLLTALRVAKKEGLELDFMATVLSKYVRRAISLDDFYDTVRGVAVDLALVEGT